MCFLGKGEEENNKNVNSERINQGQSESIKETVAINEFQTESSDNPQKISVLALESHSNLECTTNLHNQSQTSVISQTDPNCKLLGDESVTNFSTFSNDGQTNCKYLQKVLLDKKSNNIHDFFMGWWKKIEIKKTHEGKEVSNICLCAPNGKVFRFAKELKIYFKNLKNI